MSYPNLLGDHNTSPIVVNILLFSFQFKYLGRLDILMLSQTFPRKEKGNHSYLYNLSRLIEDILYKM